MYRVFLSYNTSPDEMVIVWRLQTLAAASGLHVDVPNPIQRSDWAIVTRMIDEADSVIAFLTRRATTQVKNELRYALSRGKRIIPIVEQGASIKAVRALLQPSRVPVFEFDPHSPWKMEAELAEFLRRERVDKDAREAVLALAGTLVGLLLLNEVMQS